MPSSSKKGGVSHEGRRLFCCFFRPPFFLAVHAMSLGDQTGLTRTIEPIENMIASGLQTHLQTLFNCLVIPVQSADAKQTIARLTAQQGGLPDTFAFYQWQSIEKVRDSLNAKAQALNGPLIITPQHRGEKAYRALITTVLNRYEIRLYALSMSRVKEYVSKWMFAEEQGRASFSVNYGATNFGIKLTFDENMTIPERNAELSTEKRYEMVSGFAVRSYLSQAELLETDIVYETEMLGVVANSSDDLDGCEPTQTEGPRAGSTFWSHRPYRN